MAQKKGILIDVDYEFGEQSVIRLYFSTGKGKLVVKDSGFEPYFYALPVGDAKEAAKKLEESEIGSVKAKRVEVVERKLSPEKKPEKVLKVFFNSTKDVKEARDHVKDFDFVLQKYEFDIPFSKRYLIDKELEPLCEFELEFDDETKELKKIKKISEGRKLRIGVFDLETYCKGRFSKAEEDPIIMASYADAEEQVVWSTKKINQNYAVLVKDEKELVEKLVEKIREKNLDVISTYNGDSFDFPYLKERAKQLGIKASVGADGSEPIFVRKGMDNASRVRGIQHVDAYQMLRILNRFAVVNLIKFDLESVAASLFGEEKEKIHAEEIVKIWDSGKDLERFAEYNRLDAVVSLKITEQYLPLYIEIGKLVRQTLFDTTRSGAGMLVESLLIIESSSQKVLVPNKPKEREIKQRLMRPIKGGFVHEPVPGLHERIAVMDFTSLHPTIMISHNISPDTVGCEHKKCRENKSPEGQIFCTERKGFVSTILEQIFKRRVSLKKKLKTLKKGSDEYTSIFARQQALKIMLNSFYGTLAFSRFRWYSRESAAAVTAWSRQYVKWVSEQAQLAGFRPLYGDTDSAFIQMPKEKNEGDVKEFLERINSELPGVMNLDLEGFYKRGIFVTKKIGGEAAKKRYALIDYENKLKIVGFEYVRRDWSNIAKETQRSVIETVLSEGNPEKAVKIVKETVKKLKDGNARKENLVIFSQLRRPIEKYESVGPHIAAAKKAIAKGKELGEGSVIGYIITRSGKTISEKAQLEEFVAEGNYDADYYIEHQVLPAVIKIIRELGYSKEDLIHGGKQSSLAAFG